MKSADLFLDGWIDRYLIPPTDSDFHMSDVFLDLEEYDTHKQTWKLCWKLGRSCPVGLGTSSRILRGSPELFGYFWVNLPDFEHFWG